VHRYQTGADGRLAAAQILTPTAQNEPWLADLLLSAAAGSTAALDLEDAVREADPCLPCSSAPVGGMGLQVDIVSADGGY
jgi:NAD-reducing hydrogenase large subunit